MIKILVVDDEVDVEELITQKFRRKIRKREWEFVFSRDGEDALQVLKEHPEIDLVLSDINMPKMDGLTLLQKLHEKETNIRSIIISAYSDIENIRAAMNIGAFDFITKPINFDDMEITIQKSFNDLCQMRRAMQSRDDLLILKKELTLAHKIQQSILSKEFNIHPKVDLHAMMFPAKEIGGDFYDFFKINSNEIAFLVADVSGKGIPAALFAIANQTQLKGLTTTVFSSSTAELIGKLNEKCCENNENCMFITLFYCVLNVETGKLTYTNAGHNPPLLCRKKGECSMLPLTAGVPLGISFPEDFSEGTVTLEPGDTLFIYTDGVTEAMNASGEEYGEGRLQKAISSKLGKELSVLNSHVYDSVKKFAEGTPQFDDLTYLTLRYKGGK